jgi:hypothetical protein
LDLTVWNGLVQTEKRKNKHDDDDKPDEINYSIHDRPPETGTNGHAIITHITVALFSSSGPFISLAFIN